MPSDTVSGRLLGSRIGQTDPSGHTTHFAFDQNGNQIKRAPPAISG